MSESKLSQQDVQEILKLIESAEHVEEFSLKYGDLEVRLSRQSAPLATQASASTVQAGAAVASPPAPMSHVPSNTAPASPKASATATAPTPAPATVPAGMIAIKAPMVGTFYRAPSPGAPPFVNVGQQVAADATVCIIEVMKLMSSIAAGVAGTVAEIRVQDSEPVEFGQVLILIDPKR